MEPPTPQPRKFFGWWITAAALITSGLTVGVPYYNIAFFYDYFQRAFGWSRASITLGFPLAALFTIWAGPLFIHRFSARKLIVAGSALIALSLAGFSRMGSTLWIYYALWGAPVDYIQRPYTLDEIRYSFPLRERMPSVDLNTVTFDTGSWEVAPDQVEQLAVIADGINRAIAANPGEVFLIEGHTDTVGSEIDNLSLSDRRAESVALVLSQQFGVPAENLTTQGYGDQYLKVPTQGPERANRRVTVRRITPLLTGQNQAIPLAPR